MGEIPFLIATRRVAEGHGTAQELGMMDAINETLAELGLLEKGRTFYK